MDTHLQKKRLKPLTTSLSILTANNAGIYANKIRSNLFHIFVLPSLVLNISPYWSLLSQVSVPHFDPCFELAFSECSGSTTVIPSPKSDTELVVYSKLEPTSATRTSHGKCCDLSSRVARRTTRLNRSQHSVTSHYHRTQAQPILGKQQLATQSLFEVILASSRLLVPSQWHRPSM